MVVAEKAALSLAPGLATVDFTHLCDLVAPHCDGGSAVGVELDGCGSITAYG